MKLLPLNLLLGITVCVYSETCPSRMDILPCMCNETRNNGGIKVSCFDIPKSLEDVRKILKVLSGREAVELRLYNINLGTVPSDFFKGIGIKKLVISRCKLNGLTENGDLPVLSGLEDTLEELQVDSSFSEGSTTAKLNLGHLRRLKYFYLLWNNIRELSNDWFGRGPTSLQYLTVIDNRIEKLGDKAFANLVNLRNLTVSFNAFGAVKRSMLPNSAQSLTYLELNNNGLTSLPGDIFSNMPSLSSINLYGNRISRLEQATWAPVWEQLDYVYVDGNPLECNSHLTWTSKFKEPRDLHGICTTPPREFGKDLRDFIGEMGKKTLAGLKNFT